MDEEPAIEGSPPEATIGPRWGLRSATGQLAWLILVVYALEVLVAARNGHALDLVLDGAHLPELALFQIGPVWPDYPFLLIPHAFAHGAVLTHLVPNLAGVLIAGPSVEARLGRRWTWALFVLVGAVSGALQASLAETWAWGASGPALTLVTIWLVVDSRATAASLWGWLRDRSRWARSELASTIARTYDSDWFWRMSTWSSVALIAVYSALNVGSNDGVGHVSHLVGTLVGVGIVLGVCVHKRWGARAGTPGDG